MSRIAIAVAVGVFATATAAQAQTIGATGETSASLTYGPALNATVNYDGTVESAIHRTGGTRSQPEIKGGSFEAIVDITSSHVSFESGVAVSGPFSAAVSNSGVDITLTNNGANAISISNFGSTIIPAGLGFYLQNRTGGAENPFTDYGQTNSAFRFDDLLTTVGTGAGNPFAYADFDFQATSLEATLYSLSGSMSLYLDGQGNVQAGYSLHDAAGALSGFTGVHGTPSNPINLTPSFTANAFAYAFAWDATNIVLPLNAYLTEGQSQVIQYRTSVSAYTRTACIDAATCLVAYSGFGDPIGRGGGVDSFAARGFQSFGANGPITGIVFDPVGPFDLYQSIPNGAVPEPATWMTLILGFGLLGSALRRRRLAIA